MGLISDSILNMQGDILFDKVEWLSIRQLIVYYTLLTVFKIRISNEPEYLASKLNNVSRSGRIFLPKFDLVSCQNSFTYRVAVEWNKLPEVTRRCVKLSTFKNDIKNYIRSKVSRFED